MGRKHSSTTDFKRVGRHGYWAVCHPDSDEPTISPMKRPDFVVGMTEEEAEKVFSDLDDAIAELK